VSWSVRTRRSRLPGEKEDGLVQLDVVHGAQTIAGVHLRSESEAEYMRRAHLMAAAPEMFEAIDGSIQYLEETLAPCGADCDCLVHGLRAALDKARGIVPVDA